MTMDKAKAAITDFMGKAGHHETTVHETVAPAVKHEVVKPHEHEEVLTAVDKEVHQDHYHRTVQPVRDREVLPEQHDAKLGGVVHREFDHRNMEATKRKLATEQAGFRDERVVDATSKTQTAAPTIGGEHVHHHIHETIQPVLEKEVIQPHVTHTTVPIHEVHHNAPTHHNTTALPAMNMEEFKAKGGSLQGREERYDGFAGEPKNIGGTLNDMMHGKTSKRDSAYGDNLHKDSMHGDFDPIDGDPKKGSLEGADTIGHRSGAGVGHKNTSVGFSPSAGAAGYNKAQESQPPRTGRSDAQKSTPQPPTQKTPQPPPHKTPQPPTQKKHPGLLDKLNPMTDADGDGKAGIMN